MNNYQNYYNYNNSNFKNQFNKMTTQESNNMNFNQATYDKNMNPNEIFDPYAGFIRGNMFPDLYNEYKISKPYEIEPMNEQAQMLTTIDALSFAAHDINLYLDTHPNDRDMIQIFNQYRIQTEQATREYEKKFGPITTDSNSLNTYPWSWNNMPWPWDK